ncbi:hypothetical protein R5R35_007636 [Gryllus longicercus]|uniref:Accessory gland protein n=1 Tax=Gryllus longicercus TaxID=2509291 RepID=A0AAN9V7L8_9ORTH
MAPTTSVTVLVVVTLFIAIVGAQDDNPYSINTNIVSRLSSYITSLIQTFIGTMCNALAPEWCKLIFGDLI